MASYETGYEDELFQCPVGPSLHCCICTNVIKDPVMCDNEHIFCKACITRHLMNSQTCPTCMQPLTVSTLREVPRGIRNLPSELKIRCEFFSRGCGKIIQLGDLKRHVADCGFAPAVCSNEECQLEVNKQDLLHHETAVCEHRRTECQKCNDMRQKMDAMRANQATINETLARSEKSFEEFVKRKENVITMLKNFVAGVDEHVDKQEESNRQLREDNVEMKKSVNEITRQLIKMRQLTSHEVKVGDMKKGITEADKVDREPKVVVVGGRNLMSSLNSVEMFSLSNKTWTPLQKLRENRSGASAVVHNNQIFVSGGSTSITHTKSIVKLSMNAVHVDQSIPWENFPAELPGKLVGHRSVVYNARLIIIGGYDDGLSYVDRIDEISLVPPYTSRQLATMPQKRCNHGVAIFGDKILIVGGRKGWESKSALSSVVMYDITKNECQELAPLPYSMCEMATVKWDDDSVMIMGGVDKDCKSLNKVLMYNSKTQKILMLPDMKYKRKECVAAVVKDTVIVMGGRDKKGNHLKSVESFRFDRYSWEELPEMHEARASATVVVC